MTVTDESQLGFEQSRVLVIDDEPAILDLLRLVLQRNGYLVDTESNGEKGLLRLQTTGPYDAVIVDLMMPGVDGAEVIEAAREDGFVGPMILCSSVRSPKQQSDLVERTGVRVVDKAEAMHTLADELRDLGVSARRR